MYVVLRVRNACRIIRSAYKTNAGRLDPLQVAILAALRTRVLRPIYRAHPDLETRHVRGNLKAVRATRRDIRRDTAARLELALSQIQKDVLNFGAGLVSNADAREAAQSTLQPILDAAAELTFASRVAYDAYPELWAKVISRVPKQLRSPESDAAFRKSAPPRGSVKLSEAALAAVKTFMGAVRCEAPGEDQIASLGWAMDRRSRGPNDADWTESGPGLELGVYPRNLVPSDVIDNVGGVDIVFTIDDPLRLVGKIIDMKNKEFYIRDGD
jgi:hypothetical protein